MLDEILQRVGLKYEDLRADERETLNSWMESLQQSSLTTEKIKEYIKSMRDSVETELTTTEHNSTQDLFLKARLRNYMLLEAFLSTPEKAKKALDRAVSSLTSKAGR
jgi:hypothetical protein